MTTTDGTLTQTLLYSKGRQMAEELGEMVAGRSGGPVSWERLIVRKAAVFGAGVMGAQIAAHLANANVKPILFDLAAKEGKDKNAIVRKALDGLAKLEPSPLGTKGVLAQITPANYDDN